VLEHVPANRVGAKTGPMNVDGAFVANDETLPTSEYVIGRLNDYKLSHLLLMGATTDFSGTPLAALAGDGMFRHFRALYRGPLIANTGIDRERGNRLIEDGLTDMVAFGRPLHRQPRPAGALRLRSAAGRTRLEYSLCLRSRRLHRLSGARSRRRLNAIKLKTQYDTAKTTPEQNKALVLEAFDTLFNKRDYDAASRFWSESYVQHSAHIEPAATVCSI
jgi:hypothetical protein